MEFDREGGGGKGGGKKVKEGSEGRGEGKGVVKRRKREGKGVESRGLITISFFAYIIKFSISFFPIHFKIFSIIFPHTLLNFQYHSAANNNTRYTNFKLHNDAGRPTIRFSV